MKPSYSLNFATQLSYKEACGKLKSPSKVLRQCALFVGKQKGIFENPPVHALVLFLFALSVDQRSFFVCRVGIIGGNVGARLQFPCT